MRITVALRRFALACLVVGLLMSGGSPALHTARAQGSAPEIWVWLYSHLNSEANLAKTIQAIDQARALGYTGVVFWDATWTLLNDPDWLDPSGTYPRKALTYAVSKGMKVAAMAAPYGYSNELVEKHPEWAEPQRVVGTRFRVSQDRTALELMPSSPGLQNGDFENGEAGWFNTNTRDVTIDRSVTHAGAASARVRDASRGSRLSQEIDLIPWRQYHIRLFFKTENYDGERPSVTVTDARVPSKVRYGGEIEIKAKQDWTGFEAVFNSQDSTRAIFRVSEFDAVRGALWIDDVSIEETGPVHLIRRDGAPLRIYDPATAAVFREGKDFKPIVDPHPLGEPFAAYNPPVRIELPPLTELRPGQVVAMDYYAVQPINPPGEYGMCMTLPAVRQWEEENARRVIAASPPESGIFLQYDEVRHANSCALCKAKHMSAGELLAWHVRENIKRFRSLRRDVPIYVWSDMFDPYHNAVDNYFLVEGDLAGSWLALSSDVIVMNWNPEHAAESLKWFSGQDSRQPVAHRQIIAAYVDRQDGDVVAKNRLASGHGIPGIVGIMYTSWNQDYSKLKAFADGVRQHWPEYAASVR